MLFRSFLDPLRRALVDQLPVAGPVEHLPSPLADELAAGIAEHPADWHMLQKLWLADLTAPTARSAPVPASAPEPAERPG